MSHYFVNLNKEKFWRESDYANNYIVADYPSDAIIKSIEYDLGLKLPASYIAFMRIQNGGIPQRDCHPTMSSTSWSDNHIAISSFYSLSRKNGYSIGHELGSRATVEEWGYPDIGIMICDCPSAGHDIVMLNYRDCGKDGEPQVVHVDQEFDYRITVLAPNFEDFVNGLVDDTHFSDKMMKE